MGIKRSRQSREKAVKQRASSSAEPAPRKTRVRRTAAQEDTLLSGKPYPVVGVGASAGGFEAFRELLDALPHDTGFAFVFVQHLDPGHESMLARLLSKATQMPVIEVTEGMDVEPDHVYVIPPNATMSIRGGALHLLGRRKSTERHMPVDQFLRSLAQEQGSRAIGVILSGTASDGTLGLKAIKAEGGITFAQDSKSAKYDGMPRSAIAAGCVDFVLPPGEIARELTHLGRHPYLGGTPHAPSAIEVPARGDKELLRILGLLRNATGVDFHLYKQSTIKRRILRRMALHKSRSLNSYLKYLQQAPAELNALYEDILIHVTGFFREPDSFNALSDVFLRKIVAGRPKGEPVRLWVPGCSTGEEAYSLAIVLLESLGDRANSAPIQIFGTDISESSIETARAGTYADSSVDNVSPERLRRFFVKKNGAYQVTKTVRERCIFARQDLAADPPFSRLDLISCRNVLIYMGRVLQKKVISIFHYALKPDGLLMLGKAESISGFADLFTLVDRKYKLYSKKSADIRPLFDMMADHQSVATEETTKPAVQLRFDSQKEADRIILSQYAPAGLVVNEHLRILHFRGQCSAYLAPAPGEASLSLLRMVRPELAVELRTAMQRARKQERPIRKEGIRVKRNGHQYDVRLDVVPLKGNVGEHHFLVLFSDTQVPETVAKPALRGGSARDKAGETEISRLQRELQTTREYLQSIIEEQEATNEELKSANEEVLSSNEELQSTNEELETAKEELQSTNEELVTVNEQLQNRNAELAQLNDDLANLLSGVTIPIVMLTNDRCVRRFTPLAEKLLNLIPADVGRPIDNLRPNVVVPDLSEMITEVIEKASVRQREVRDLDGRWYSMVLRPYRTTDNKIEGVVMIFIDIDSLKRTQAALQEEQEFAAAVLESAGPMVLVTGFDGRIVRFNRACQRVSGYSFDEVQGRPTWNFLVAPEDVEEVKAIHRRLIEERAPIDHENHWVDRNGDLHLISWTSATMAGSQGTPRYVVRAGIDITERRRIEQELQRSERALRASQAQLRTLTASLIEVQEEERTKIALDLHDDIGQRLAALMLEASALRKGLPADQGKLADRLSGIEEALSGMAKDIRLTAHQLHPSALEHLGFPQALRSLCQDVSRQSGIEVKFTANHFSDTPPGSVALSLYRIAQEALKNVVAHSGASEARVALSSRNDNLRLLIRDAGCGFDWDGTMNKGLGLFSMEERARQIGATLRISAKPGQGTGVEVLVPLKRENGSPR
jgi:two-component system CheB/CheR fusion protein